MRESHQYYLQVLISYLKMEQISRRTHVSIHNNTLWASPLHRCHWRKILVYITCCSLSVVGLSWEQSSAPTASHVLGHVSRQFWPSCHLTPGPCPDLICATLGIVPRFPELLHFCSHNETHVFSSSPRSFQNCYRKQLMLLRWVSLVEQSCIVWQQRIQIHRKYSAEFTRAWMLSFHAFN